MMNCIAAVDSRWGIGKDNQLLFHIPDDLKYFREKTTNKVVVMGKNTLLSLPNQMPLPNRKNIVLSTSVSRTDCVTCTDISSLFALLRGFNSDEIFVIGGEDVYKQLLPYCSTAYITKVNKQKAATKFFPNLDLSENWELRYQSDRQRYKDIEFCFCEYSNTSPLLTI